MKSSAVSRVLEILWLGVSCYFIFWRNDYLSALACIAIATIYNMKAEIQNVTVD